MWLQDGQRVAEGAGRDEAELGHSMAALGIVSAGTTGWRWAEGDRKRGWKVAGLKVRAVVRQHSAASMAALGLVSARVAAGVVGLGEGAHVAECGCRKGWAEGGWNVAGLSGSMWLQDGQRQHDSASMAALGIVSTRAAG